MSFITLSFFLILLCLIAAVGEDLEKDKHRSLPLPKKENLK